PNGPISTPTRRYPSTLPMRKNLASGAATTAAARNRVTCVRVTSVMLGLVAPQRGGGEAKKTQLELQIPRQGPRERPARGRPPIGSGCRPSERESCAKSAPRAAAITLPEPCEGKHRVRALASGGGELAVGSPILVRPLSTRDRAASDDRPIAGHAG